MAKADFSSIYTAPDPRPYYATLSELDYQIPDHAGRVFSPLASHLADERGVDAVKIADLCSSYGINAAVIKHRLSFSELAEHYTSDKVTNLDHDELVELDREWYAANPGPLDISVVGFDISQPAIEYARDVGLHDADSSDNLEIDDPSPEAAAELAHVDLVTVTGGIGYITDATIGRVLEATPDDTWLAAFSLRWIDFEPVAAEAERHGLVTERWDAETFPQRRFTDDAERQHALDELARLGEHVTPGEANGYHEAALYVMRPVDDATVPVEAVLEPKR